MSYKSKLLINFTALFAVFTLLLVAFQYNRERQYRRLLLEERLRCYANLVAARQGQPADSLSRSLPALDRLLPPDVRLTIIDRNGTVRHETSEHPLETMGNHLGRPEVQQALMKGEGSDKRESTTEQRPYFYFAKAFGNEVVRVALPYDDTVRSFMQADRVFLWFVFMLFPVMLVLLIYISDRFGKAVTGLKNFMRSADRGLVDYDHIDFPHSELGDIGRGIMTKYRELEASNRLITTERERLLRHFHNFGQGIAIFSPERECIYANPRFMQYANVVLDRPTANPNALWQSESLAPAVEFLQLNGGTRRPSEQAPLFRYSLSAGGTTFGVQVLIYADGGFELTLTDITAEQQQRELKQQMSNNITHELRTPVSSIRGYLETVLNCQGLPEGRKQHFLRQA
ncbi:MAG: histidine kinase dimerization/phospho-acceptor domain-containing protein, partial [Alloprevotella sp.]